MPIYMDRHDVSEQVTAEIVADLHQKDLKIQHKFNCKGLTYWFDDTRKTAFCLVEAPDKTAIEEMHNQAHGAVPHRIIEVDSAVVESFLGRIEDPEKSQNTALNIINDPAFRTIMVAGIKNLSLKAPTEKSVKEHMDNLNISINETAAKFKGRIVRHKSGYILISFDSVTDAVGCALEIKKGDWLKLNFDSFLKINIGLSAGVPVTSKEGIFEDTILLAERLCDVVSGEITISSEVKDLYESENLNMAINREHITVLGSIDEKFLNLLMDYTEREWRNTSLNANDFSKCLGYSKSQLYRKMILLTGKSPHSFIKEYRLNKALERLNQKNGNISDIAYETGFNTPAYFSKCFRKAYGMLPSVYTKSMYPSSHLNLNA
ncbi:AraC-type DNA-binding protein [Pricia antarctica]|uniref:AraC-type DNA-binding protein n=1 Tax=Pricia antarctica TaxID=641691 RepID=A0A1G7D5R5_9FLAO|nr:nickel-binding protein [Pricia antarctica]SDE46085.1 AraC-type DNA-binding protein [Pricia antarctica]